jgi:hypothetical protein
MAIQLPSTLFLHASPRKLRDPEQERFNYTLEYPVTIKWNYGEESADDK